MVTDGWISLDPADIGLIESVYKKTLREGEERLMLAVLENAVEYFQKYVLARNPSGKQLFQEAEEWFLDKENEALYSFESICETLGLHPDHIRKGLMVWKEAKLKLGSVEASLQSPEVGEEPRQAPFNQIFQDGINLSCETFSQQMNMVDLERLKEQEDTVIKIIDSWPRIFQLLIYRQLYAHGIRITNIDSEIEKELKESA